MRTSVILEVVEKIQDVYKCANNIEQENIIQPNVLSQHSLKNLNCKFN